MCRIEGRLVVSDSRMVDCSCRVVESLHDADLGVLPSGNVAVRAEPEIDIPFILKKITDDNNRLLGLEVELLNRYKKGSGILYVERALTKHCDRFESVEILPEGRIALFSSIVDIALVHLMKPLGKAKPALEKRHQLNCNEGEGFALFTKNRLPSTSETAALGLGKFRETAGWFRVFDDDAKAGYVTYLLLAKMSMVPVRVRK